MTSDIHPHWKSVGAGNGAHGDGDSFWPMPEEAPAPQKPTKVHRVRVARSGVSLFLVFTLIPVGIGVLGFVFLRGVNLIRADLVEGIVPDHLIELTDTGFSRLDTTVKVGEVVAWENAGGAPRQFRSRELNTDGSPLLASSLLEPQETFRLKVPSFLEGQTLTLTDAFIPTMVSTLMITEGEASSLTPLPPAPAPKPLTAAPPPASLSVPLPSLVPPPDPRPTPTVSLSPTINVGVVPMSSPGAVPVTNGSITWPALLRINPYTFDRAPSLSPTAQLPIHSVARAREKVQSAKAKRPPARKQPETGPALWIIATLSLCGVPLLLRKRKNRG